MSTQTDPPRQDDTAAATEAVLPHVRVGALGLVAEAVERRSLRGRVVLVTGGSSGIGRATAQALHDAGAEVVFCGRRADRLAEASQDMPRAHALVADTTVPADREGLVEEVLQRFDRLDAVVLNAGQGWAGLVEQMREEDVERLVAVNLTATIQLARLCLPHLLESRGDVLAISSVAAWASTPPLTVYCATKHGVEGFLKGLRREVTARGVRVHSVNPGPVRTEWLARGHGHPPTSDADARPRLSPGVPPETVAASVLSALRSPWSRTAAVPRVMGLSRLGEVTPVNRIMDLALSRSPGLVSRTADHLTGERVDPADRRPS